MVCDAMNALVNLRWFFGDESKPEVSSVPWHPESATGNDSHLSLVEYSLREIRIVRNARESYEVVEACLRNDKPGVRKPFSETCPHSISPGFVSLQYCTHIFFPLSMIHDKLID